MLNVKLSSPAPAWDKNQRCAGPSFYVIYFQVGAYPNVFTRGSFAKEYEKRHGKKQTIRLVSCHVSVSYFCA